VAGAVRTPTVSAWSRALDRAVRAVPDLRKRRRAVPVGDATSRRFRPWPWSQRSWRVGGLLSANHLFRCAGRVRRVGAGGDLHAPGVRVTEPQPPLPLTKEEAAFGFGLHEEGPGLRAVLRQLPNGLWAVKVQSEDGTTTYSICDEHLRPLYRPATSLGELRRRFGLSIP
jgi:hypothetical protein